ncbi:MAG: hypothetical protein ABSG64_08600 [Solirubrobacteraceae bacterium]
MRKHLVAIGAFAVLLIAGCGSSGYPSNFTASAVKDCVNGGESQSVCTCVVKKVEANESYSTYKAAESTYNSKGTYAKWMVTDVKACLK